jgi:hypothetical protein
MQCHLIKHCDNFSMQNFIDIQTVNNLAHTKDDTAAVTIKAYHSHYIITFGKTRKAD